MPERRVAGNDADGTHAMHHSAETWLTRDGSLVINLKAAKALGFTIPTTLLGPR